MSPVGWWQRNFLRAEFLTALLVTAAFAVWLGIDSQGIDDLLKGNRSNVYAVLASIWGALLGFVIATVSIVLVASQSPRMDIVRRSAHYGDLWKTYVSTIRTLGGATVAAIAGLMLDRDPPDGDPNHVVLVVCFGVSLLAILRLARSVWILERVVDVVNES